MLKYAEYHHAFISAAFYKKLRGMGEQGLAVFVLATQRYAEQRGSRMAQRAIALGMPLNFETYCALGEWNFTDGFLNGLTGDHMQVVSLSPDYCYNVFACPWQEQYKAMGLSDGAVLYCKHLDLAIARGFNPYLDFRVLQTLHETDRCVFTLKDANLTSVVKKRQEWVLPFEYHCAHVYHTFSAIAKSVLKTDGVNLAASVLTDFAGEYGGDFADKLVSYESFDFNVLTS